MSKKIVNSSEKILLIAIPTNDGKTIFPEMLGMARYFYIYTKTGSRQSIFVEKRLNPYETTMQHLKTLDVYTVIADCEIIIASLIGKKGIDRLQEKGIKLFFQKGNIKEALSNVFSDEYFNCIKSTQNEYIEKELGHHDEKFISDSTFFR